MSDPEKRRALEQLGVSDEITPETRTAGHRTMAGIGDLVERSRAQGPLRDAPLGFVVALMNAVADASIDFMSVDPANADKHCADAFDALWRIVT